MAKQEILEVGALTTEIGATIAGLKRCPKELQGCADKLLGAEAILNKAVKGYGFVLRKLKQENIAVCAALQTIADRRDDKGNLHPDRAKLLECIGKLMGQN